MQVELLLISRWQESEFPPNPPLCVYIHQVRMLELHGALLEWKSPCRQCVILPRAANACIAARFSNANTHQYVNILSNCWLSHGESRLCVCLRCHRVFFRARERDALQGSKIHSISIGHLERWKAELVGDDWSERLNAPFDRLKVLSVFFCNISYKPVVC